jgi:hypothetical protein
MEDKITGVVVDIPTVIREAKQRRWISVKEKLPDNDRDVLIYSPYHERERQVGYYGQASEMFFYEQDDGSDSSIVVTHWQELPDKPTIGEAK